VLSSLLKEDGLLMIAHSSSKDHINQVHRNGSDVISSDFLPDSEVMAYMMLKCGLKTEFIRDDDGFYIVTARKSRNDRLYR
jgi:demethylmenaquinone methyltransferase/2-methoxy-6-polyprenyl-1,4-benzoquinol methylase